MAIQVPNETPAIQHELASGIVHLQPVERRGRIGQLARAVVEIALAATDAAEIEAQHREAALGERVIEVIDDLIVHGPPELRMGVQDQRDGTVVLADVMIAGLDAAGGAVDDELGHVGGAPSSVDGFCGRAEAN